MQLDKYLRWIIICVGFILKHIQKKTAFIDKFLLKFTWNDNLKIIKECNTNS